MADNPRIKELFSDIEKELKRYFKSKDESERKLKRKGDDFIQVYLPLPRQDSNCNTDKVHYEIFDSGVVQLHLEDDHKYNWIYEFKKELKDALEKECIHEDSPKDQQSWIRFSLHETNEPIEESDDDIIVERIKERLDKIIRICEKTILKYKITTMDKNIETSKKLLKNNHNLILTGAPGTGKTYLAKQIATKMIFASDDDEDKEYNSDVEKDSFFKEHCCFVQFHPSYDYTDFVEGLRPIYKDGNIGFERQDGIFKQFCKKALKDTKQYVFIIDEINRGDISKILGELFFSIDPGYRGEKGRVKTQYQNLIEKGNDVFDDGFYVPKNVYIIGTMNDIDRSVESMDFAMRRRFTWKEITAESQADMLNTLTDSEGVKKIMNALNEKIGYKEYGLSSAYHIGPAYFLKFEKYDGSIEEKFNQVWNNHLKGVLNEYLRGNDNETISDTIKAFKSACEEAIEKYKKNNNG